MAWMEMDYIFSMEGTKMTAAAFGEKTIDGLDGNRLLKAYYINIYILYFRWKVLKWRPEHLGALGIMGETAPLTYD